MKSKSNIILCCLNAMTVPSILLSILSHVTYNDLKAAELKELESFSLGRLICNCVVIGIQPYRFLEGFLMSNYDFKNLQDIEFKVNYVLVLGSLFKFGLFIPSLLNMHKFKNPRSSRVCKIYGCSDSNLYTIKCNFKQNPILLITSAFLFSFIIFSFAFRVSERSEFQ